MTDHKEHKCEEKTKSIKDYSDCCDEIHIDKHDNIWWLCHEDPYYNFSIFYCPFCGKKLV